MTHEEISDQFSPTGDPRRRDATGRGPGTAHRTHGQPRPGRQRLSRRIVRILPGMQSAFIEVGLERTAFLHVADIGNRARRLRANSERPIEKILAEGQSIVVQVVKDPVRHRARGCRRNLDCRAHAGLSAAGENISASLSASRRKPSAKCCAKDHGWCRRTKPAASSSAPWPRNASDASRQTDIAYLRKPGPISVDRRETPAPSLLYQELSLGPARAARFRESGNDEHHRLAENFREAGAFARRIHAGRAPCSNHYTGERPVRSARRRGRNPEGAGAARRSEIRRLPDHRPDRGDDHHRRQYRRLCRCAQLRRHRCSRPISKRRRPSPASCACAISAASSLSISSTWENEEHKKAVLESSTRHWRATTHA